MYYISMYIGSRCQEFYLTQTGTWSSALTLGPEVSGLASDISFPIRALENAFYLSVPEGMRWEDTNLPAEVELHNGAALHVTHEQLKISILAFEMDPASIVLKKYTLLPNMAIRIGRNPENALSQSSNVLSASHAELLATSPRECWFTDHSRNGSYINGERVLNNRVQLNYGDVITLGFALKIVYLGDAIAVNDAPDLRITRLQKLPPLPQIEVDLKKAIQEDETQPFVWYHRSPRIMNQQNTDPVDIEPPLPRDQNNMPPTWMTVGPSATMVVPMLLSAMVGGRSNIAPMVAMMGGAAAMAVMWGLINSNYRKKHGAEREALRTQVYKDYLVETKNKLMSLTEQEQARLNEQCLTIQQCLELPKSNTHRLWERMPQHSDFTVLRLGLGRVPLPNPISIQPVKLQLEPDSLAKEPARLKETYEYINNAPITVCLREWRMIGVLGNMDHPVVMQSMLAQLAATHSYHDVIISVLCPPENQSQWDWARWLPHVYANEDHNMRLVACTRNAVNAVLDHLNDVLMIREERLGERSENAKEEEDTAQPLPHYVVFCTDPALLENSSLIKRLMSRKLGFTLVMQATSMEQLPKECGLIIHANDRLGSVYTAQGDITNVQYETTNLPSLKRFGHQLAPLRVKDALESSFIPSLVTFLEIYHAREIEDIDIWRFWNENHAYEGLRSTIGLRSGAQPFVLDISEGHHGPHGLVAGTTGSGKSVMLQTYILSLALNYHPEEVQFILIDYKGGGMANAFVGLPHVAGVIDNLQGKRTISRALLSIQGEIHRREEIFKRLGVEKIDEYIRYYNHDPNERPLAHLIIVVDEFAELKKEQPEFMRELVSTARVGRSVGIHMILATQKPSNSVDDEIWSNTNFRICLRVATRADSNDMLKHPDAAYLKGMGRCYVQVGNDEIYEQVQTSFSGATYAPANLIGDEEPRMLDDVGRPIRLKKKSKARERVKPKTQMDVSLEQIQKIMKEHGVSPARRLWLQEIEQIVLLEQLPEFSDIMFDGEKWKPWTDMSELRLYYGMVDDVRMQRHLPLYADLLLEQNLKILAPAGAGKTTLIQTMVMSAALSYTPEQVNMYIFSLTSRTLGILGRLPHVGEVVFDGETAEIIQLLNLIAAENEHRKALFSERMTDSFTQYNVAAEASGGEIERLPAIIVFIDRMKQLMDVLDEERLRQFYDLVLNAASRGIFFVATAIALNREELGRVSDRMTGIALQQEDRAMYKEVLGATGVITADEADVRPLPGRGLIWFDNGGGAAACEMQCAIYGSAVDTERVQMVTEAVERMNAAWHGKRPHGIVRIPETLDIPAFNGILEKVGVTPRKGLVPVGLDKEDGKPRLVDLDKAPSMLITGDTRSGRTNTLLCMAEALRQSGAQVHLFGASPDLAAYAVKHPEQVTAHPVDNKDQLVEFFKLTINPIMIERKQALAAAPAGDKEAYAAILDTLEPLAIMFDDYDQFAQTMMGETEVTSWLPKINQALTTAGRRVYFILTLSHDALRHSTTNAFIRGVSKSGIGLALGGRLGDADPWGVGNVTTRRIKLPLGEGMFISEGRPHPVALPVMT